MLKKRQFINTENIRVSVFPCDKERTETLYSGFLQCLNLSRFISKYPDRFVIDLFETKDELNWNKTCEIIYERVVWHGCVNHSCKEEMTACQASIDFTYTNKHFNYNF